jgi:hypothetical protein
VKTVLVPSVIGSKEHQFGNSNPRVVVQPFAISPANVSDILLPPPTLLMSGIEEEQ